MDAQKLKTVPLFSALGKRELRRVAASTDEVDVREGEQLLNQGTFAHEFMVVLEGRAEVVRDSEMIAELGPGDFLGEVAALDHGTRTASVTARTPMIVAVMSAGSLRQIAREMPKLGEQLRAAASEHSPLTAS